MTRPLSDALTMLETQPKKRYGYYYSSCVDHVTGTGDRCHCPKEKMCAVIWLIDRLFLPADSPDQAYEQLAKEFGTSEDVWRTVSATDYERPATLDYIRHIIAQQEEVSHAAHSE